MTTTLKMICEDLDITPRTARKLLRKEFGAKGKKYTFTKKADVTKIKKLLTPKKAA